MMGIPKHLSCSFALTEIAEFLSAMSRLFVSLRRDAQTSFPFFAHIWLPVMAFGTREQV
jgi:hypothetical protein